MRGVQLPWKRAPNNNINLRKFSNISEWNDDADTLASPSYVVYISACFLISENFLRFYSHQCSCWENKTVYAVEKLITLVFVGMGALV